MTNERYKQDKINFVSHTTGSSVLHINAVSLVALVSVALYACIITRTSPNRGRGFATQWTLLILPLLLSMTLFATTPTTLSIFIGIATIALLWLFPRRDVVPPLPSNSERSSLVDYELKRKARFPFMISLTVYRAHMMLMTVLAILAVDFPVFPRMLAKCETFGVSLMDLGVGSFVFSQGLVSAIPFISEPYYLLEPISSKLIKTIRKSIPVLLLGLVRVLLVKGTDYPEHVTEYGVHWNFFLTLAFMPILQVLLHPVLARFSISMVALGLSVVHQILLVNFLQPLVLSSSPRLDLFTQNKEGIVSLLGYLSIHILGLSFGTIILPYSPSFFRKHQAAIDVLMRTGNKATYFDADGGIERRYRQTGKTAQEMVSYSFVWWVLFGVLRWAVGDVSRRLVNLPYILWVAAFNTSFFLGYFILLDILFFPQRNLHPTPANKNLKKSDVKPTGAEMRTVAVDNTPTLFTAINRHGLFVFLLANVLTGGINISMRTMYIKAPLAMCVLGGYSFVVCGVAWWLDRRGGH